MSVAFDTLSATRKLEEAGLEARQAEAIVTAIRSVLEPAVTKPELDSALSGVKTDLYRAMGVQAFAIVGLILTALKLFG